MRIFSLLKVILNFLRSLLKYNVFFVVYKRFNNSVFIMDVIIMFYLFIFYIINLFNRRIVYPYKFFWLFILLIKEIFKTIFNLFPSPNLNFNVLIFNK